MKSKLLDQWFTTPETVALCMAHIDTSSFTDIIDPCAGDKAFKAHCSSFYDIDPRHPDIIQQDFMELVLPYDKNRLFLTNFPYGKSGKLSIQMINHASTMADTIATIVPNTLLRYSAQKRVNSELKLILSISLPEKSFTLDGKPVDVPSQFQVWSRAGSCLRVPEPTIVDNDDWFFDNKNPNFIVMTNTREVKRIEDMLPTNNCKKIHSHLSFEELVLRFGSVKWKGVPMMRGGGFSITNAELSTQYKAGMI